VSESPFDSVTVEAYGTPRGRFNLASTLDFNFRDWTAFALTTSITAPAEASFELGDDSGWDRLSELVGLGAEFRVFVNDRCRLTGRVEQFTASLDARQSTTQRFCVRTRLSDAACHSAPAGIRLAGQSVKQFVLAVYADLGFTEADFDFRGDVSRDIMTGKTSRGGRPPRALEPLKDDEAKVNPPETCFAAADRHLRRHGFMHWDGPDGKIVVAAPDDEQEPLGVLTARRDGQLNNIVSIDRDQDVSQAPTELGVFGTGGKAGVARAKVSAIRTNADLIARGFRRRAAILDEGMRTRELATRRVAREFSQRNRGLDRLTVTVDGLSYREGREPVPWAPDTTVDVVADPLGGVLGAFYIEDVQMARAAQSGDVTRLSLVRRGAWQL